MSMNTYPLEIPLAFVIDEEIAAYLILKMDQENQCVPEAVQKLLDANDFFAAVLRRDKVLDDEGYFDICNASDILHERDIEHCYATEFDGEINYLDRELDHIRTEEMSDDYIAVIEPLKQASLFKAAYAGLDEPIEEFRKTLAPAGAFPENFDWASKLVAVTGTYFC